jgi:tetratricopeptide (TPR) repeat protein
MKKYAIAGLVILLPIIGWIGWNKWNSNAWQTYLIKRELRGYVAKPDNQWDGETLDVIVQALAYAGDSQPALQVVDRITDARAKVYALRGIAEFHTELGDKEKASALLLDAIKTTEQIDNYHDKLNALEAITVSIARLGERGKAKDLMSEEIKVAERSGGNANIAVALRTVATSYAKLGETVRDRDLLEEAIKTADRISDTYVKATALGEIAMSYARLGKIMKNSALLEEAIKMAERAGEDASDKCSGKEFTDLTDYICVRDTYYLSADALKATAMYYAMLGESMKDGALLDKAIKTADRISNNYYKAPAQSAIAESYAKLGDKEKTRVLLEDALRTVERIDSAGGDKAEVLIMIYRSYARVGETMKDGALLEDALKTVERTGDAYSKLPALSAIAEAYAGIGDDEKCRALLKTIAERISRAKTQNDARALDFAREVVKSYARLGVITKDSAFLEEAIKTAEQMYRESNLNILAVIEIVRSYAKLAESSNDPILYDKSFRLIEWPHNDRHKNRVLDTILSSKLAIADVGRLRSLTSHYSSEAGKALALSRILMAVSRPDLIGKERNPETATIGK